MSTRDAVNKRILAEFAARSLWDTQLVLATHDALALIERAHQERCPVLGVDGFFVNRGTIQPSMEHSIDYTSEGSRCGGAWQEAAGFVRDHGENVSGFEVVVGERGGDT